MAHPRSNMEAKIDLLYSICSMRGELPFTSAWRWSTVGTRLLEDRVCVCVCVCVCVHADGGGTDDVQCFRPFTDQM